MIFDKKIGSVLISNPNDVSDLIGYERYFNIVTENRSMEPISLVIGYDLAVQMYPNMDIFEKNLDGGIWWSYSKKEKISDYFWMIKNYPNLVVEYFLHKYKYNPINYNFTTKTKEQTIEFIIKTNFDNIYYNNRSAYFLKNEYIYSLDFFYFGFLDKDFSIKIKEEINKKPHIYDKDYELLQEAQTFFVDYSDIVERYILMFHGNR